MQRQGRRDTAPELALRRLLHRRGLRYRVDVRLHFDRRRRADILFRGPQVAVFVDGCFWHRCPVHGNIPRNNRDWWAEKLEANRLRDADTDSRLRADGWEVLRFWEHELEPDASAAASRVEEAVRSRR